MPRSPYTTQTYVPTMPDLNYLVRVDGISDDEATPYRGPAGLRSALVDAQAIKAGEPDRVVTIEILHAD